MLSVLYCLELDGKHYDYYYYQCYLSNNFSVFFFLFKKTIQIIWTVMISIAITSHISTMKRNISHFVAAPLITFIRVFYPLSISWMIIASQTGHGGMFAKIMDHPIFVHVNKLSYGIYLLNPLIISAIYGWQKHSTHIDPLSMVRIYYQPPSPPPLPLKTTRFNRTFNIIHNIFGTFGFFSLFLQWVTTIGFKVIIYMAAVVFSIMFELPYTNLTAKLLRKSSNKKSVISQTSQLMNGKKSL